MTPQEFLNQFGTLAEAEGGVKKLRELILDLALRGKLLPKTEEDQALLARDTIVGDFLTMQNGYAFKSQWFEKTGIRLVRNANIGHGELNWSDAAMVSEERAGEFERFALSEGDIVLSLDRPLITTGLKVARIRDQDLPSLLLQRVARPVFNDSSVARDYFYLWLQSPAFTSSIDPGKSNGVPHIATRDVLKLSFSPPTKATQHRIVAKVNELMRLCDGLEVVQKQRRGVRLRLNRSSLDRLTSVSSQAEVSAAWQRVCDHFQVLYDTPETLPDLRQTILQLAVQGKLVKQDPKDDPAETILDSVRLTRRKRWETARLAHLTENGRKPTGNDWKTKYKPPQKFEGNALPGLPSNWSYVSPDELAVDENHALTIGPFGSNLVKSDYRDAGVPLVFVREIRAESFGGPGTKFVDTEKANELASHMVRSGDVLITKMGCPPGDTSIYPDDRPPAVITADCIKLTPDILLTTSEYLRLAIRSQTVAEQIKEITAGIAHQKVSLKRFRPIGIPLPPLAEQKRIVSKVTDLLSQVTRLESTLTRREATRTQLLTAAIHSMLGGT